MLSNKMYRIAHRPHEEYMMHTINIAFTKLQTVKKLNIVLDEVKFYDEFIRDQVTFESDWLLWVAITYTDLKLNKQFTVNEREQLLFADEVYDFDKECKSSNCGITVRDTLRVARTVYNDWKRRQTCN